LLGIALFTAGLNLATNIVMLVFIMRLLPGFRISPFLANFAKLKEISSFSVYSYVCTISDIFVTRTDRLVIGFFLGIESLGVYQIGTRLPEMMEKLTTQFQATLGPVVAAVYKSGDFEKLRWILLRSTKISAFVTGYFLVLFLLLSGPILKLWLKIDDPLVVKVSSICLVSVFIGVLFRSVQGKFLLMAGKHKHMALLQSCYAVLTLLLMVVFVRFYGLLGLLSGALLANALISVFVEFPFAARLGKMSVGYYLRKVYFPLIIPMFFGGGVIYLSMCLLGEWNLFKLGVVSAGSGVIYLVSGWFLFFGRDERCRLVEMSKTGALLRRFRLGGYLGVDL
jgi:O-antigen/teichoic acid export membrane protein